MRRGERDVFDAIVAAAEAGRHLYLSPSECALLAKHPDIASRDASRLGIEWRPIAEFPGYEVSEDGRVRRGRQELKTTGSRYGHGRVSLYNAERQWRVEVHRLVAIAFLGQPPAGKPLACHRNGVASDNRASNLYWGSFEDNVADMKRHSIWRGDLGEIAEFAKQAEITE